MRSRPFAIALGATALLAAPLAAQAAPVVARVSAPVGDSEQIGGGSLGIALGGLAAFAIAIALVVTSDDDDDLPASP